MNRLKSIVTLHALVSCGFALGACVQTGPALDLNRKRFEYTSGQFTNYLHDGVSYRAARGTIKGEEQPLVVMRHPDSPTGIETIERLTPAVDAAAKAYAKDAVCNGNEPSVRPAIATRTFDILVEGWGYRISC